jgi:putative heme-binding domain-containing protein
MAAKLFSTKETDRQAVIQRYQTALGSPGDAVQGKSVFKKVCATCHKLEETGHAVGPDLAALSTKTTEALLIAILDPSRDVDARYQSYAAVTADGKVFSGVLADETSTSITIIEAENKRHVLLRTDLEELRGTGKSAMPDGVEKDIKQQEMADLLAYLASTAPKPKKFSGNKPTTVSTAENGQLTLLATNGAIYGGDILFEQPFQNIGYWHGENDRVTWRVQIDNPGMYDVYIDFACHNDSAGNAFRIDGIEPVVRSTVAATGGWDRYRHTKVGSVALVGGLHDITVRPDGKLSSALFDLRAVYFVPRGRPPLMAFSDSVSSESKPTDPEAIARMLLDDGQSKTRRENLIADHPGQAGPIVAAMVADLRLGSADEYRRIPWIWHVSIAAGKRNDADELRQLLDVALPTTGQPLSDWRAVVIGGGIVNGISLSGVWPGARMKELLKGESGLVSRWRRSLGQAASMADNLKIRTGTRYDALRMIAMDEWDRRAAQLLKYLESEQAELQMGAVSGLADVDSLHATRALLNGLSQLTKRNRSLALAALVRNESRMASLLDAIEARRLKESDLNQESLNALLGSSNEAIRRRAKRLLTRKGAGKQ